MAESDERCRYYRLTDFGRRVAAGEAGRLAGLVRAARRKNLLPTSGRVLKTPPRWTLLAAASTKPIRRCVLAAPREAGV